MTLAEMYAAWGPIVAGMGLLLGLWHGLRRGAKQERQEWR